jgi:glycosyl hydrolase family 26
MGMNRIQSRLAILGLLIVSFALAGTGVAAAANTVYLFPNGDKVTSNPWAVTGASTASQALTRTEPFTEAQVPDSSKYISANVTLLGKEFTTEVELGTTTLAGAPPVDAKAEFYTSTSTAVTVEAKSGSVQLGKRSFTGEGWHVLPIALDGSQGEVDNLSLRFMAGGSLVESGLRQVRSAFLRLTVGGPPAMSISRLRPNEDISTETPWSVTGAAHAWEALDDSVTEPNTPGSGDYISTPGGLISESGPTTEVGLQTTSLETGGIARRVVGASAWFYTPNANSLTVEARSGLLGSTVLAKETFASSGWHSIPIRFEPGLAESTQSLLDNLRLRFRPGTGSSVRQVYAAFARLEVQAAPESIYWGAWMDGHVYTSPKELEEKKQWGDAPWEAKTWERFESDAGKHVSVVHYGQPSPSWGAPGSGGSNLQEGVLDLVSASGSIPLMDMDSTENETYEDSNKEKHPVTLAAIASGEHDSELRLSQWAAEAKIYGKPFFLRWGWEMNGNTFQWAKEAAENPELFVKAWRHFHDVVVNAGATNVTWVWCPNVLYAGTTDLHRLYPGDKYVDWLCMDGYNHGSKEGGLWTSFGSLFSPTYNQLLEIAPTKPVMIGETASTAEGVSVGGKPGWITEALSEQLPKKLPDVRAFLWFNWDIEEEEVGKEKVTWDWPIDTYPGAEPPPSQAAFASGIASGYYAADTFGSLPPLTKIEPLP